MVQVALTELNRILVTDGRAPLRTNEVADPYDCPQSRDAERLFMCRRRMRMITSQQRIGFYRAWSSHAARQALSADQQQTKDRCAHSAGMWSLIADALEAGDDGRVAGLTHNLAFFRTTCLVPAA
ncbi:hypothetical protein [Sphingomonas sp. PR090111-T3T-6A]|uniref:hypothetical protein n=1 Tax=Sphingomonas sp. PR090111-T3T-6A TaxID=685778 RepID=UPI000373588A|nr:hypothetical protein [Sphingomonas sp. PR090111-T3T-6A]